MRPDVLNVPSLEGRPERSAPAGRLGLARGAARLRRGRHHRAHGGPGRGPAPAVRAAAPVEARGGSRAARGQPLHGRHAGDRRRRRAGCTSWTRPAATAASEFGIAWANALLDRYARGHWVLVVDADELLVFPGSDRPGALARAVPPPRRDRIGGAAHLPPRLLPGRAPAGPALPERRGPAAAAPVVRAADAAPGAERALPLRAGNSAACANGSSSRRPIRNRPGRLVHQKLYNLVLARAGAARVRARRTGVRAEAVAQPHQGAAGAVAGGRGPGLLDAHAAAHGVGRRAAERRAAALQVPAGLPRARARTRSPGMRTTTVRASTAATSKRSKRDPAFRLHSERSVRYAGPDQLVELGMMRDTPLWAEARGAAGTPPSAAVG